MKGYIYQIIQRGDLPNPIRYIGSTVNPKKRWSTHRHRYKNMMNNNVVDDSISIYKHIFELGLHSFKCETLIEVDIETLQGLRAIEQQYIEKYDCVNKVKAFRSPKDKEAYNKQYNYINRSRINDLRRKGGKARVICECGMEYNYSGKTCHVRTQKHIRAMTLINNDTKDDPINVDTPDKLLSCTN